MTLNDAKMAVRGAQSETSEPSDSGDVGLSPRGQCTHDHADRGHENNDLASLQGRYGARRGFAGPGSQSITKRGGP